MMQWLWQNMGNIVVIAFLALVICFAVRSLINDKKTGKSGCSHGCSSCALHGECHKIRDFREEYKAANS